MKTETTPEAVLLDSNEVVDEYLVVDSKVKEEEEEEGEDKADSNPNENFFDNFIKEDDNQIDDSFEQSI